MGHDNKKRTLTYAALYDLTFFGLPVWAKKLILIIPSWPGPIYYDAP